MICFIYCACASLLGVFMAEERTYVTRYLGGTAYLFDATRARVEQRIKE